MAWNETATALNTDETLLVSGGDTSLFYSRWVRAVVDPRLNGLLHIVYEMQGQHASDDMGCSYIQFDMDTQTVVRRVQFEPATTTGNVGFGHPDIAVNPADGRIWIVYIERADGPGNPDPHNAPTAPQAGNLFTRVSADGGVTWSPDPRHTIAAYTGYRYLYPRIAFGADGTGHFSVYAYKTAVAESTHQIWSHSLGVWTHDFTYTHPDTSQHASPAPIAVNNQGKAVCIASIRVNSTTLQYRRLTNMNDGVGWIDGGSLQTFVGTTTPDTPWGDIIYDIRNDVYQFITLPWDSSGDSVQHAELDKDFQINFWQSTAWAPFSTLLGPWLNHCVTTLGDIYVAVNTSATMNLEYRKWTRSTNTWDSSSTAFGFESQVADHSAATEPSGRAEGGIYEYLGRLQFLTTGDEAPTVGSQEYIWTSTNPTAETVTRDDLFLRAGDVTTLANYEAFDDAGLDRTSRRVVAWIGANAYHDNDESEFAGNAIEDGKFNAVADFKTFESYLYIADGENTLARWHVDDTLASTVSNTWDANGGTADATPKMMALEVGRNRLWGITLDGKVVGSGLRNATEWNTTQPTLNDDDPVWFYINDFPDGELPIGIKEFYGNRYIFSQNGIVRLRGDRPGILMADIANVESALSQTQGVPFVIEKISDTIGLTSHRAIVDIGSDLIFPSRKGIHRLSRTEKSGDVEQTYASAAIQSLFESLDKTSLEKATAVNYKKKNWYVINVARDVDNGAAKTLLVYDYARDAWQMHVYDFEITCLGTRINSQSGREELLAGTSMGHVVILDQDSRVNHLTGTTHTATCTSQWIHNGDAGTYDKYTRAIFHHRRPSTQTITGRQWVDDSAPTTFTLDQNPFNMKLIGNFTIGDGGGSPTQGDTIGEAGSFVPVKSSTIINKRGRTLKVELTGNMSVSGFQVQVVPGKFRDTI